MTLLAAIRSNGGVEMVVKLFGPNGAHFGWMYEGDVFDSDYQPLAFSDDGDLYSFSRAWLGTHDRFAVYDRQGLVVATVSGRRAIGTVPSRLGRMPPRIAPRANVLPEELRNIGVTENDSNSERWEGMSMAGWLAQQDP